MPGRLLFAIVFSVTGALHFAFTPLYVSIMPSCLPHPKLLVQISGVCEILGGLGVLFSFSQAFAAWGIVALLVCVMPANLNMALHPQHWPRIPGWALWVRLPLQLPLIYWAWTLTK